MHTRNIILKARQLGFTTEVCIIQLDAALFQSDKCALIAHNIEDAKRLFREKVKYAYGNLPIIIKQTNSDKNESSNNSLETNTTKNKYIGSVKLNIKRKVFGKSIILTIINQ